MKSCRDSTEQPQQRGHWMSGLDPRDGGSSGLGRRGLSSPISLGGERDVMLCNSLGRIQAFQG